MRQCLLLMWFLAGACASSQPNEQGQDIFEFYSQVVFSQNNLVGGGGKMYALLVGVDRPNYDFHPLQGPSREIAELAKLLKKQQYAVKTLSNETATKNAILFWLDTLVENARAEDRILVYFTGHASPLHGLAEVMTKTLKQEVDSLGHSGKDYFLITQQPEKRSVTELISMQELIKHLEGSDRTKFIRQRIVMVDACFGGHFIGASPLTNRIFDNDLPPDGFYAITSLKDTTYDGQYFPIIKKGLEGDADLTVAGNRDGFVGLFELSNYIDNEIGRQISEPRGEKFYSRYIMIGSGEVPLTVNEKRTMKR